jgi:hypothetical protein
MAAPTFEQGIATRQMPNRVLYDIWENEVVLTEKYISHRNRSIYRGVIQSVQAKGRRLLVNGYKQNTAFPTMCIFFESAEKAQHAYRVAQAMFFDDAQEIPAEPVEVEAEPEEDEEQEIEKLETVGCVQPPYLAFAVFIVFYASVIAFSAAH